MQPKQDAHEDLIGREKFSKVTCGARALNSIVETVVTLKYGESTHYSRPGCDKILPDRIIEWQGRGLRESPALSIAAQ